MRGTMCLPRRMPVKARKLIEENPLDLILLDIWMPDTDGVTLLRELSSQHLIHCPVIMMSGHATIDTAVEATKFGAFDFLEKPISMQRLLSSVSNALAQETPADTESRQQDAETQSEPSEAKAVIYGHQRKRARHDSLYAGAPGRA